MLSHVFIFCNQEVGVFLVMMKACMSKHSIKWLNAEKIYTLVG